MSCMQTYGQIQELVAKEGIVHFEVFVDPQTTVCVGPKWVSLYCCREPFLYFEPYFYI